MQNYTVYHLHSDLSSGITNIDSITKFNQYVDYAKELEMTAIGFSEHGSIFEWVKKKETIEKAGMKYIHAEEFYVTKTLDEKIRDNKHVVLIAKNYDGVLELNKLSSVSFNREDGHYYYVPRITIDELISTSKNIIVTTACLGGILVDCDDDMRMKFIRFLKKNNNRCYLEIQHHNVEDQIKYNKYLYGLSKKYDIPLIAGTDTHALNEEHLEGRRMLQKAKNIYFDNEDGWDLSFKTYDELVAAYKKQNSLPIDVVIEAIENTNVLAKQIEEFELDRSYKYPHLWDNPERTLRDKISQGIIKRGVDKYPNYEEYLDRIEYEMKAYIHNEAIDFMLLMEDIIDWCNSKNIKVGYGRGSVNGSVIAWLLGITEMDSIKYNLNFDRFMNVERVSLSDIDTDFPPSRINEVKNYIFNHHGLYCCDIVTFNTIADKGAIRDIGRALNMPLSEVSDICETVDNEEKYQESRDRYSELFKYVDLVKGVVISIGNHPCGMVVSPQTLDDNMGLCSTSTDDMPISQIYMKEIDGLNYVKLDLLKLDTIELINNVCEHIGIERLTPDNIDINDVNVWNSMRDDTTSIFQWEGKTGDEYIKKLMSEKNIKKLKEADPNLDRLTLLSMGNSAIRPAGASYRDDLANGVVRKTGSKAIDEFLAPTFGYLVFQCQIIEFLHRYCGYTMGEADVVRRGFAKKTGTEEHIPRIKAGFIKTMTEKYGSTVEKAEEDIISFIQVIEDASRYLFSLNHSQPYTFEAYVEGYLRYYYPLVFITDALNLNTDKEEKTVALTNYAKKVGINIISPKFRYSKSDYMWDEDNNCIYKGISSITYMNNSVAEYLYSFKDNSYDSFIDLLIDINDTNINSRQLDILIKLDFFSEFGEINTLLKQVELFNRIYGKKQFKKDNLEKLEIPMYLIDKHCNKITEKIVKDFNDLELLKDVCETYKYPKTTTVDKLLYQQEYLGYIQLVLPKTKKDYYFVSSIDNNWATLYQLKTGNTLKIKFRKKEYNKNEFIPGDVIKVVEIRKEPKWYKEPDGSWGRDEENLEDILHRWDILEK